ncbi:hypothetical protein [Thalassobacillus pellis]|uniref:hypothetical protein n=1 Tax=Thalassobacillus pellis TaxID=748008 RepID=UPI00195F6980|nr:hypothetical protein [Thalassobacillus pellis]MBM7554545.1 lipid-A-disaccharide synthase-like uncharacterized protein [Thalassobacillus pellis]
MFAFGSYTFWDWITFTISIISVGVQWMIAYLSRRPEKSSVRKLCTLFFVGFLVQLIYIYYFVVSTQPGMMLNPLITVVMYVSNLFMVLYKRLRKKEAIPSEKTLSPIPESIPAPCTLTLKGVTITRPDGTIIQAKEGSLQL